MSAEEQRRTTIGPETMLPDLLRRWPQARAVFDRYGLSGCGGPQGPMESVEFFARSHGVDLGGLLAELRDAARGRPGAAGAVGAEVIPLPGLADTIYRRFFLGGILVVLTAGATWGAGLLWAIGLGGDFTGVSVHDVNAHGHAQIYGWVGLFIMGFAYQAFPRVWHTRLVAPPLAAAVFAMMAVGIAIRTVGMTGAGRWAGALPLAMSGAGLELAAVVAFAGQMAATLRAGRVRIEPYVAYVLAALGWLVAMALLSGWHTWNTMTAASADELVWYVATWQAPLRDIQIHGLALFMIVGVSLRMLPGLFDLPRVPDRTAWTAFGILTVAVVGEVALFLGYRLSGSHWLAALLLVPWLLLAVGCWMVSAPWRLWRPFPEACRSEKFIRAAWAWLAVSLAMLLAFPFYQSISGQAFSHAYYGAIRHAVTVGFISLMIVGMAAKVVPTLNGVDPRRLSALWGPFVLINVGCFLRVTTQTLTDFHPGFFSVVGVSGVLEVSGLAWWGIGLIAIMAAGRRAWERPSPAAAPAPERPARIEAEHVVADVLAWWPQTEAVLLAHGFTALRQPVLRATLARQTTLAQAARLRGVPLDALLAALNDAVIHGDCSVGRA